MGVTIGVTAFAAALTFGASSTHLLDTPRLYGWNWDLALTNYNSGPDLARRRAAFAREPAIEEVSIGDLGIPLDVNGRRVGGIALEPVRGRVLPPVIEGRAPDAPGEVMLGGEDDANAGRGHRRHGRPRGGRGRAPVACGWWAAACWPRASAASPVSARAPSSMRATRAGSRPTLPPATPSCAWRRAPTGAPSAGA